MKKDIIKGLIICGVMIIVGVIIATIISHNM